MAQLPVLQSALLADLPGVRHAFFSRRGGVSKGIYEGLNVGRGSRDAPSDVAENRRRAASHFNAEPGALLTCHQVHSTAVVTADAPWGDARPEADGVATTTPGLVCGALAADCAPILYADAQARVIAAVHSGWRGALSGMPGAAVEAMIGLGAARERIVAVVGPCIGQASYEVGLEFLDRFETEEPGSSRFFAPGESADKRQFDLPGFVLWRLAEAGVRRAEWVGVDTCANEDFFSNRRAFRRSEGDYGRLLSAIALA